MTVDEWDEDLPQPPRREWPGLRRLRVPIAVLAVAGAAAAAIVSLLPSGTAKPDARRTPAPVAVSMAPTHFALPPADVYPTGDVPVRVIVLNPDGQVVDTSDPSDGSCPARTACRTRDGVPEALRAAVRARFPHLTDLEVTSVEVNHAWAQWQLWSRTVVITSGRVTVTVRFVTSGAVIDPAARTGGGPGLDLYVHERVGSFVATVHAIGGDAVLPARTLRRLAADPALRAVENVSRGLGNGPGQH